jgi:hypothetical protein
VIGGEDWVQLRSISAGFALAISKPNWIREFAQYSHQIICASCLENATGTRDLDQRLRTASAADQSRHTLYQRFVDHHTPSIVEAGQHE